MYGIGTDLVEIKRIEKAIKKESFLNRYFTPAEINYFLSKNMRAESVAGAFAAKEAVVKALGTGFSTFTPECIEILHMSNGMPYVKLYAKALDLAESLNIIKIHISISHTDELAMAFALAEGGEKSENHNISSNEKNG